MKTKGIILSLVASTIVNIPPSFAKNYQSSIELSQAQKTKFELFPVKLSKTEVKDSLHWNGRSLIQLTKKPVIVLEDFEYQTLEKDKVGIKLVLSPKKSKALEDATRKYQNTRLAILHNGTVLMAPTVKSIISDGSMEITFRDQKQFEDVLVSLKGG